MNDDRERIRSHFFTLRVWVEDVGNGRTEFRGTLKQVLTGETHHFRDWTTLTQLIEASMATASEATASKSRQTDEIN
ncbi:MAG: hypothetical protein GY943_22705 [Chloroflexi bacterium]|nr:hypothetical protein [Chloroflexota bacterium]